MAQFAIHGSWKSVAALASLFAFLGLLIYTMAGGLSDLPVNDEGTSKRVTFGLILYGLAFSLMIFGFWSKEDVLAVAGIMAISLLIILDILLRVGVLSFNHVRVI